MANGRQSNVIISTGKSMTTGGTVLTSYKYKYIDFNTTEILQSSEISDEDVAKKDIRNIMLGKNQIVRVWDIHQNKPDEMTLDNKYDFLPCGIQSSQGSIISMPIIPQEKETRNGLDVAGQTITDGYNWNVTTTGTSKNARNFGYFTPQNYITNKNSRIKESNWDDYLCIQERAYKLTHTAQNPLQGSFIFCYDIEQFSPKGQGSDIIQQNKEPLLQIVASMNPNDLQIYIPPTGAIRAKISGGQQISGGMSVPDSELLPPPCDKTIGGSLKPLFIYPTYGGIVINNCINKNINDGGGEIFVRFPKNGAAIQHLEVDSSVDADIQNGIDKDSEPGSVLKWIPAIYSEKGTGSLSFHVEREEKATFGDTIGINWIKCVGSFAYCPLYFYPKLYMDVFFKGAYKEGTESNLSYDYEVYPIAVINGSNKENCGSVTPTSYYKDTELKETIYRAKLKFNEGNKLERYPTQIFGCIVALKITGKEVSINNSNGTFSIKKSNSTTTLDWVSKITNVSINCGLQGPTGSVTFDSYEFDNGMDAKPFDYNVGEIDLNVKLIAPGASSSSESQPSGNKQSNDILFKGYGLQVQKSNSNNNYQYTISLVGVQQKLQDIKLVCAPFWDGDQLKNICKYLEAYTNCKLYMIDNTVSSSNLTNTRTTPFISGAKTVDSEWKSSTDTIINNAYVSTKFRVPRSVNWESPAIDFPTGTSCLQALKTLGEKTSCFFTVGLDGNGYFYELNKYGLPYYAANGQSSVTFKLSQLISFSLTPAINNKYNAIATFGFLQKKFKNNKTNTTQTKQSVMPGSYFTKLTSKQQGNIIMPWSRMSVRAQSGFFTKTELLSLHVNRVKYSIAGIYQGSVQVLGNVNVNHVYQTIKLGNETYFVTSIEHNIDVTTKVWTTTYGIQKFDPIKTT